MINFNELRVTDKCLIIDASVSTLPYYDNVYIDTVIVDTQDTYMANGPSGSPVFNYTVDGSDVVQTVETICSQYKDKFNPMIDPQSDDNEPGGKKNVRIEIDQKLLGVSLNDTLFFVYVTVKGTPAPDTPCGMDNQTTMGVVANLYPFYRSMMCYMKETLDRCDMPKNFLDKYLRFKAFELSLKTCHYTEAINMWNKFFRNINNPCQTSKTPCGCHG